MDSIATNQSKSSGDVVLELEYEIEEDIEAELEDFVRLSHTCQFEDAQELFDECLSSHVDWYPVTAEYADCLLRQGDFEGLTAFSEEALITFKESQENALLELMLLIGSLLPKDATWRRLQDLWPELSLKPPYTSLKDIEIHLLEIVLQILVLTQRQPQDLDILLASDPKSDRGPWSVFIDWFYYLVRQESFWDAQRILHSLFHKLPWIECWYMVQEYITKVLNTNIGQESVQIAVSSMIQRFVYVFKSMNPNILAVVPWNDAVTWALYGNTLTEDDESSPSLFSRICLRRSLQKEFGVEESLPLGGMTADDEMSNINYRATTDRDTALVQAVTAGPSSYTLDELNDWAFASAELIYSQNMLPFLRAQDANSRDGYLRTPLHWASLAGRASAVETLIEIGEADTGLIDCFGCTPLHYALSSIVPESEIEGFRTVKALLESGSVSVNTRDPSGLTPLHMAIVGRSYKMTELLLDHNAIVEMSDYGALLMLGENNVDWLTKWKLLLSRYDHPQAPIPDRNKSSSEYRDSFTLDRVAAMYGKASQKYPGTVNLDTDAALILRVIPPQTVWNAAVQTLLSFLLENDLSGAEFPYFPRYQTYLSDPTPTATGAIDQNFFNVIAEIVK